MLRFFGTPSSAGVILTVTVYADIQGKIKKFSALIFFPFHTVKITNFQDNTKKCFIEVDRGRYSVVLLILNTRNAFLP